MKRNATFILSLTCAVGIYLYIKTPIEKAAQVKKYTLQTFEKKANRSIASHSTTGDEIKNANIEQSHGLDRSIAEDTQIHEFEKNFPIREKRLVIGENPKEYEDENKKLEMINKINPEWKSILGLDLLKYQSEDTKVIIREEYSVIKISEDKGQYLEQVIITYLLKNGDKSSYRAFVDSETGAILETWDRTIHEKQRKKRIDLKAVPLESAIVK